MDTTPAGLQGIGIPWFSPDEWKRARAAMHDAHLLGQSHAEFVANVQRIEDGLRRQGAAFVRVAVVMEDFHAWCRLRRRQVDAQACAQYAAWLARRHDDERARRG